MTIKEQWEKEIENKYNLDQRYTSEEPSKSYWSSTSKHYNLENKTDEALFELAIDILNVLPVEHLMQIELTLSTILASHKIYKTREWD